MYIHNYRITVTWIRRFKGVEILNRIFNNDTLRVQNSFLRQRSTDFIKSIGLNMEYFFWILKNSVFSCSIDISFVFKMKLLVQIKTQKYIIFVVYLYRNMCYMELRNHIDILIYLAIYITFSDLHEQTHIVIRFISVSKIYSYVGTWSILFDLSKLEQLIAINNDIKKKQTFSLYFSSKENVFCFLMLCKCRITCLLSIFMTEKSLKCF